MVQDGDIKKMLEWCDEHPGATIHVSKAVFDALKAYGDNMWSPSGPWQREVTFNGIPIRINEEAMDKGK